MILLAILTGVVGVYAWKRHVSYLELILLCSWGLLAAGTPIGHFPAEWLTTLAGWVGHLFQ